MNWEVTQGNEIEITSKDMIVSTTDKKGTIIYANDIFCKVAGYERSEVIGQPHNMIRHPRMPKVVFRMLWDRVLKGEVIYAFVKNIAKNGDYYWVKAYVKPIIENGEVVKITSYRKPLNDFAKEYITRLYDTLLEYEKTHNVDETLQFVENYLKQRDLTYDQFIDRLSLEESVENIPLRNVDYNKQKNNHLIFKEYVINCAKKGLYEDFEEMKDELSEFKEWFDSLENESFSTDEAWKKMKEDNNNFQTSLRSLIEDSKNNNSIDYEKISVSLNENIKSMFENLTTVRDRY